LAATACPALEAGAATIEITPQPPVGVPMSGYDFDTYSQAMHDPLHARVLVLDDGRSRTALITLDLIGLNQGDLPTRLRELGISNWVLASSHTHGGPKVLSLLEPFAEDRTWPVDDPYVTWLENRIVEGTARALERMQPATLSVAKGSVDISFNRRLVHTDGTVEMIWGANRARRYTGPTDPEVGVVRVDDRAGNPLAILLNYACHPVVLGNGNRQLTADYPGYACAYLERRFPGTVALFLQGADGDLDPYIDVQNDFAPAQDQGEELGREVERVVRALDPYREGQPHALELNPLIEVTHYQHTFAGFYDRSQSIETPFSLLRIGDRLAFVNLPGEPFVELQLDLKARSPLPFTFLIGYANGYAGYFPTLKANREGGYGANSGGTMHLEAAAGEVMVARALEELTASFWEQPLPKVVIGGSVTRLLTVVRPPLLQADAPISVTVDLSQLGGSAEEELTPTEDGRFSLDVEFPLTAPAGRHEIWFTVVQQISTGPHVTRVAQTLSVLPGQPTAVAETDDGALPQESALDQNYPNPFNAETAITFRVNVSGHVDLAVFDLAGQRIRTLFSGRRETGAHVVRWNGRDDGGTEVASGVYLYRLETREFKEARRLALLK
jgi:neutral ceramidase